MKYLIDILLGIAMFIVGVIAFFVLAFFFCILVGGFIVWLLA